MARYWCVNFDFEPGLRHGIENHLWMMQYQFADNHGNDFQSYKTSAITKNWTRAAEVKPGDWFVAYLKRNTFFAIGRVRTPRSSQSAQDQKESVAEYLAGKTTQDYEGRVLHTAVFYSDFTDNWRHPEHEPTRYAQRIDVEQWRHYVPDGVKMGGVSKAMPKPHEIHLAVFEIRKSFFDRIVNTLARSPFSDSKAMDEAAVEALETTQAKHQGFSLDSKLRKALENYAMNAAKQHFTSDGYVIEDHSKNRPYDLRCTRGKEVLHVEVKGTQTQGEGVFLTFGEVEFAGKHKAQMVLFLLHSIKVSADKKTLTQGQKRVIEPWDVDHRCLKPVSYQYKVPGHANRR